MTSTKLDFTIKGPTNMCFWWMTFIDDNPNLCYKRLISDRPGEWRELARSSCWRGWRARTRRVRGEHATWPPPTCARHADAPPPWYALDSVGCSHSADLGICPLSSPVENEAVVINHHNFNLVPGSNKFFQLCSEWVTSSLWEYYGFFVEKWGKIAYIAHYGQIGLSELW